ncbi:hypothetical protein MF672_050795 (plasmid) [Actinomadura sp. ATCC 31491]|uniref:SnoaL-like domain-containing protein n=1 Tax=Actinomadura luzonensis TaxID=2805427 RepID=A0ABT0GD54_9ACTN|nr:hypothetical protein [Actinomadura luzonensis]MCK2222043.1 hypothetical protein [Actinomadura luzonensis]
MSETMKIQEWAGRYVAQWNEPDPDRRAALVRELWAGDGVQVLVDPPQAIREAAAGLAFPAPPLEVRGHEALEARVRRAYEMFVAPGEHVFAAAGEAFALLPGLVALRWSMVSARTGERAGGGLDVLALDADGRIRTDHQFIEAS